MMNRQRGKFMIGLPVSDCKFQGVSSLDELEDFGLQRPAMLEKTTLRSLRHDEAGLEAKELRESVQRRFNKPRMRRAEIYSAYIETVENDGQEGGVPAITIWCPERLEFDDSRGLEMPWSGMLVAIDGETQTEARFMLRDRIKASGRWDVAVTLYHGIDAGHARQILHDYNKYATPISESETASLNKTGPLSRAVQDIIETAGLQPDDVNRRSSVPGKKELVSYQQLLAAVTGMMMGSQALKSGVSKWYGELNRPTSREHPKPSVITTVAGFVATARDNPALRRAAPAIWQIAGALSASGPIDLRWDAGAEAWANTKSGGRGGRRFPVADRLDHVARAMQTRKAA